MTRPKNDVRITPNNREKTVWKLRKGKQTITKSSTTIWKALRHWERCLFKEDIT